MPQPPEQGTVPESAAEAKNAVDSRSVTSWHVSPTCALRPQEVHVMVRQPTQCVVSGRGAPDARARPTLRRCTRPRRHSTAASRSPCTRACPRSPATGCGALFGFAAQHTHTSRRVAQVPSSEALWARERLPHAISRAGPRREAVHYTGMTDTTRGDGASQSLRGCHSACSRGLTPCGCRRSLRRTVAFEQWRAVARHVDSTTWRSCRDGTRTLICTWPSASVRAPWAAGASR